MQHMRNLTLASAKHLMTQGHITPAHHARIVSSIVGPPATALETVREHMAFRTPAKRKKAPPVRGFGSLAQQAQAPIPGSGVVPVGTATGYEGN